MREEMFGDGVEVNGSAGHNVKVPDCMGERYSAVALEEYNAS